MPKREFDLGFAREAIVLVYSESGPPLPDVAIESPLDCSISSWGSTRFVLF
jgi:hypothetical protein